MIAVVRVFQALLVNMRIHLGGGNIRVPEHFLDYPQVAAVVQ